jgi:alpha-beta hydrolase superfamily lysophospholipase
LQDVGPSGQRNGRTVVLLHGRNFPSSYWAPVIKTLVDAGFRVIVPDQIGFGKSSKPSSELHFDTLARNSLRPKMGKNAELAKQLAELMPNGRAEVIPNTGSGRTMARTGGAFGRMAQSRSPGQRSV